MEAKPRSRPPQIQWGYLPHKELTCSATSKRVSSHFFITLPSSPKLFPKNTTPFLSHGDGEGVGMRGKTQCLTNVEEQGILHVHVYIHRCIHLFKHKSFKFRKLFLKDNHLHSYWKIEKAEVKRSMYLLTVNYMKKVYSLLPATYTLGKLIAFYTRKIAGQRNKHLAHYQTNCNNKHS